MRRLPSWEFRRRVSSARYAAGVAVGLLALCVVASALAPASHPEHHASRRSPDIATAPRLTGRAEPPGNPVSAGDLADARATATRFLAGYLPFVYGRAPASSVTTSTPELRQQLAREGAALTPAERERHPRVLALAAVGQAPGVVLATAVVEDGGIATYALRLTLERGPAGWLVSAVNGG